MVKIQNRELLFSDTFLLHGEEVVSFELPIREAKLKIHITFLTTSDEQKKSITEWKFENGEVNILLKNWNNSSGTTSSKPVLFANKGDEEIFFDFAGYAIGDTRVLHVNFLIGAKPNV